ncbi:hypothetical protein Bca101_028449 [Brassica carinata]
MVESAAFPGGYYRNAFEAPHESQDSGSSAQIDTEVTASENSTTPARKRINLNPDDEDPYGVRRQAIPLYNMSQSESKDLIHRLKRELEQTKIVLKNAELLNVRSTSRGWNRNILETPAPSEKQYRAALLKNKFADIILKAREKTLPQNSNKGDPEKLRKEREELELQMQKERARLQAEAEAAEDARRQAEAEAAAEAAAESKRKRELEREAARQALLKDLEMLSSSAPEQLPSSVDETSPERGLDPLGSFNFRGINPLEQLGLYMKQDDDDEEGPEAPIARAGLV